MAVVSGVKFIPRARQAERDASKAKSTDDKMRLDDEEPSSVVGDGDGGASWRLKAFKPAREHLHAVKDTRIDDQNTNVIGRGGYADMMRRPKVDKSLSWGKIKDDNVSKGDTSNTHLISAAVSSCRPTLSANQLSAKALQLRMKGKHQESEKLLKQTANANTMKQPGRGISLLHKKKDEDADLHLAQKIMHSSSNDSISGQADDEYDFDHAPRKKHRSHGSIQRHTATHMLTQQERCQFCFENPTRPRHLVISIANFTYLMLPQSQPLVQGHCCILTTQHESSTRNVDDNISDEIRNFKKCLIMMFAKQHKQVVFLETVMGLSQQRRHCLVECIPLPKHLASAAPPYFKKAIDEAEDEWSQHNAKKLIDTSVEGLRGSIPINFPYFYVEFGLDKGFVHVIDDEKQFQTSFGLNVLRGMLELPEEDMHRRRLRRQDSMESQRRAVLSFAQEWAPFDWTKALD